MSNNYKSDIKYIPYKEVIKNRALDYYYSNKEAVNSYDLKTRKSCKSIINKGLITNRLKDNLNYDKKHKNITKIDTII